MGLRFHIAFVAVCFATSCATQEQAADRKNIAAPDSVITLVETSVKVDPLSSTLNEYYKVKDAFVRTDGTGADMAAMQLRLSIDSLNAEHLENIDSSTPVTSASYKVSLLSTIDQMIKERDMQQKRKQFSKLSDYLYNLAYNTGYKGVAVYRLHCPMAFDKGANWLSNQPVIANPYFGSKMMECGEVTDSLMGK